MSKKPAITCYFCGTTLTDTYVIPKVEFRDGRRVSACVECWKNKHIGWDKGMEMKQRGLFDGRDIREAITNA